MLVLEYTPDSFLLSYPKSGICHFLKGQYHFAEKSREQTLSAACDVANGVLCCQTLPENLELRNLRVQEFNCFHLTTHSYIGQIKYITVKTEFQINN